MKTMRTKALSQSPADRCPITAHLTVSPRPSPFITHHSSLITFFLLLFIIHHSSFITPLPAATPFTEEAYWAPVANYPRPGDIHGVLNINLTDHYLTSHALHQENQGVMVQPLLLLTTPLYADRMTWLSDLTLTLGGWGSYHTHEGGDVPAHWREADLISGLTATFARDIKLSAFYSAYLSQTQSYDTAWELAVALSYDDTALLGDFALHPFVEYRQQTEGRIVVDFVPDLLNESHSFKLGITPQHQFKHVKLELPTYVTLVPKGFYQRSTQKTVHERYYGYDYTRYRYYPIDYYYPVYDGQPAKGGIGYFSTALKASVPLKFMSTDKIACSLYGAVQYYRLVNEGLLDGNVALDAAGKRERDILQFHLGLTMAF